MPEPLAGVDAAATDKSAELQAANEELAAFIFAVSHDVRAPLRTIEGFSEALIEDYGDKLDAAGRDYLARIRSAAERMEVVIKSLGELAEISRIELRPEPVDLSELARSIADEMKAASPSRHVEFSIEPGLVVEGDRRLLKQALQHLLENAWKFTSRHPTALIQLGTEEHAGRARLYVRDDGVGFDPSFAGRLFAPFQRFHAAGEFEGIGIGLATVRRVITRHRGRVWATSGIEEGTTVYIELG